MDIVDRMDNIYVLDCKMRGCDHYLSSYLVVGKEIALVDTGQPNRIDETRAAIHAHGFSVSDISHIFVTHEHRDHGGNVGPFLRESPGACVYLHPLAVDYFVRSPKEEKVTREAEVSSDILNRPGERDPVERVPMSRIKIVQDGDRFDLGNGEGFKIMYAPGHTPGSVVIHEEKHNGLFVHDLLGNCFFDADSQYVLNPITSDHLQTIETLKKLKELASSLSYVYLGHYGIYDNPERAITKAYNDMKKLLDIGKKHMKAGTPDLIADEVFQMILPELEKLRPVRGEETYQYAVNEHVPYQANLFAKYCQRNLN